MYAKLTVLTKRERKRMKLEKVYLGMAVAGFIIPWLFLLDFLMADNVAVGLFFRLLFANPVAGAVSADLLISALVFVLFVFIEGNRLGMKRLWLYPVITFGVGLSFALPVFLYFRTHAQEVGHG